MYISIVYCIDICIYVYIHCIDICIYQYMYNICTIHQYMYNTIYCVYICMYQYNIDINIDTKNVLVLILIIIDTILCL